MTNNKSKLFLTFTLGALAGAAIAALFTTEKGKKILSDLKNGLDEFGNDLRDNVSEFKKESTENPDQFKG